MSDILKQIKEKYHLSQNDEMVAEYILNHLEEVPKLSSREIAKKTYTSATSIIRFVKKLGYENYNDFKYNIVSQLKNLEFKNADVFSNEDLLTLTNKISQMEIDIIKKTKELLSLEMMSQVVSLISETNYIDIYANDTNATMAYYFQHLLSEFGKFVQVYQDTDLQINHSLHVSKDHVIMMLSKHSRNEYLIDIAKTLNKRQCTFVLITGNEKNTLSHYATYVIHTPYSPSLKKINELHYFTSVKYIFDFIYSRLYTLDYEKRSNYTSLYNEIFFRKM